MDTSQAREKVREYWEERAKQYYSSPGATTDDIHLRELEIAAIVQTLHALDLPAQASMLDVGCGDGHSTLGVAEALPDLHVLGIDYSQNMIRLADERLQRQPELQERLSFLVGDVMNLRPVCADSLYDVVLTDRCLINLDSLESQYHAMAEIADHANRGGHYIAIENFVEGHENMNAARRALGVPEIPVRWHNLYFREDDFIRGAERFFESIAIKDFASSYYFATRVIYSAMCQMRGEEPDYDHEIHRLAVHLPWVGQFSPIRMAVMRRKPQ